MSAAICIQNIFSRRADLNKNGQRQAASAEQAPSDQADQANQGTL